ncbi:MAG TPA: hypothetical protein VFW96_09840, partial [Thermomicrobiales bacterium]|nr:hypothetical protein [Thermomicrobiales bacterium]
MSDDDSLAASAARELAPDILPEITPEAFAAGFGEALQRTLDVATWTSGEDLAAIYRRTEAEIREAVAREEGVLRRIRQELFPRLAGYPGAPPGAGVRRAELATLERIHRGLLFNGGVEACDGTRQVHDTLALTIYQIGVGLVSYKGDQGTFGHRLYRRDLRIATADPTDEMIELLERRARRGGVNHPDRRDGLADLAQGG